LSTEDARPERRSHFLRDLVIVVVIAVVASFVVRGYLLRSFSIPSASMEGTLMIGDRVLVNELVPRAQAIHRGDVVVFRDPGGWLGPGQGDDLIKRVIGLPGDRVSCCDAAGRLEVNGHAVTEPYVLHLDGGTRASLTDFSVTVPTGQLWVMGDNRDNSADSRMNGTVPVSDIVGRAFLKTWPLSRVGSIGRPTTWNAVP
jgi:signal peptidase I